MQIGYDQSFENQVRSLSRVTTASCADIIILYTDIHWQLPWGKFRFICRGMYTLTVIVRIIDGRSIAGREGDDARE